MRSDGRNAWEEKVELRKIPLRQICRRTLILLLEIDEDSAKLAIRKKDRSTDK
jgi:hypothetical protein